YFFWSKIVPERRVCGFYHVLPRFPALSVFTAKKTPPETH
ncbi:unnamed protein product, partial [Staurois parvus]